MISTNVVYFDPSVVELLSTTMYSPVCYFTNEYNVRIMVSALKVDRSDFYFINTLPAVKVPYHPYNNNVFYSIPAETVIEFINMYKNQRISLLKLYHIEQLLNKN